MAVARLLTGRLPVAKQLICALRLADQVLGQLLEVGTSPWFTECGRP